MLAGVLMSRNSGSYYNYISWFSEVSDRGLVKMGVPDIGWSGPEDFVYYTSGLDLRPVLKRSQRHMFLFMVRIPGGGVGCRIP